MVIGITVFVVALLVVAIWVAIEIKRVKHKLFAIFWIGFILLAYFTFVMAFKGVDTNFTTFSGIIMASKVYFNYISAMTGNFVQITANVIKMDWAPNVTSGL